jgi:c(7)-type cytochrome triheme protein
MSMRRLVLALLLGLVVATVAGAQEGAIQLKRPGGPADPPPAVFPHWIHRIRYTCYACHPAAIGPSSEPITHEAMGAGKACGACHDGKTAWGIGFATCTRCHVAR